MDRSSTLHAYVGNHVIGLGSARRTAIIQHYEFVLYSTEARWSTVQDSLHFANIFKDVQMATD